MGKLFCYSMWTKVELQRQGYITDDNNNWNGSSQWTYSIINSIMFFDGSCIQDMLPDID